MKQPTIFDTSRRMWSFGNLAVTEYMPNTSLLLFHWIGLAEITSIEFRQARRCWGAKFFPGFVERAAFTAKGTASSFLSLAKICVELMSRGCRVDLLKQRTVFNLIDVFEYAMFWFPRFTAWSSISLNIFMSMEMVTLRDLESGTRLYRSASCNYSQHLPLRWLDA